MQNNIDMVKRVAKHLKVSDRVVIKIIHSKKLKASKVGCSCKILEKYINKYLGSYTNYKRRHSYVRK